MIPLGVEPSTAAATAADSAAPTGFLDGLLAALTAGASATAPGAGLGQMAKLATPPVIDTAVAATAGAVSAVVSSSVVSSAAGSSPAGSSPAAVAADPTTVVATGAAATGEVVAVADPPVPTVAHDDEQTPVTTTTDANVVASPAADDDAHDDLPVAPPIVDSGTPPVPPTVWSSRGRPGRRVALHTSPVELSEAPSQAGSTPQHRRDVDVGETVATASASLATPAVAGSVAVSAPLTGKQASSSSPATSPTAAAQRATTDEVLSTTATAATAAQTSVVTTTTHDHADHADDAGGPVVTGDAPQSADVATGPTTPRRTVRQQAGGQGTTLAVATDRSNSAVTFALIDAGAQRDPHEQRLDDKHAARFDVASSTSFVADRADATSSAINTTSAKPLPAATPAAAPAGAPRSSTPLSLGMIGVDRVRFAREQAPSRAVQRLAIDLDGAQVALRFRGDRVAVDVLNDPNGNLGNGWARQVERSLDQAVRTVNEPQRGGQASDQHQQPADSGRRDSATADGRDEGRQRRSARTFELFPEEES